MSETKKQAPRKAVAKARESHAEPLTPLGEGSGKAVCKVAGCFREPVQAGLCGGHWATRRDLAKEA